MLNALGVTEAGAGAIDEAIKRFKEAIAVAPAETISYLNLGKSLELHYFKKRQYLAGPRLWVSDEHARQDAISSYERYLALGGPYGDRGARRDRASEDRQQQADPADDSYPV